MTEKLRYIGKPTDEFEPDEVYSVLWSVHQGFLELKKVGGQTHKYASLAMLLKFWQPPS
jgi:hypothetical protein